LTDSNTSFSFDALVGKKTIGQDKNYVINLSQNEHFICCCRKAEPHDETMKFKLIGAENDKNSQIFPKRKKGQLDEVDSRTQPSPLIHDERFLIGRQPELQTLVSLLTGSETTDFQNKKRLLIITGAGGNNKVEIAKYAAEYC